MEPDNVTRQNSTQEACRLAATGKHAALLNLLLPFSLFVGFGGFYLIPLAIYTLTNGPTLSANLELYLRWSTPVVILVTLTVYSVMRTRLLAPYIKKLSKR